MSGLHPVRIADGYERAAKIAACQIAPVATPPAAEPQSDGVLEASTADAAADRAQEAEAHEPQPEEAAADTETDELPADHYRAY